MSEPDVEVVKRMFGAFARRDVEGVLRAAHPDIEFAAHGTSQLAGRSGPYRGHAGLRQYFDDVAAQWQEFAALPRDFRAVAGSVVIFGRVKARRPGEDLDASVIWTWRIADGLVVSGSVFPTVDPAGGGAGPG